MLICWLASVDFRCFSFFGLPHKILDVRVLPIADAYSKPAQQRKKNQKLWIKVIKVYFKRWPSFRGDCLTCMPTCRQGLRSLPNVCKYRKLQDAQLKIRAVPKCVSIFSMAFALPDELTQDPSSKYFFENAAKKDTCLKSPLSATDNFCTFIHGKLFTFIPELLRSTLTQPTTPFCSNTAFWPHSLAG